MTIVMTILASDNARNRRRAKRAAERALAVSQPHISRIDKAVDTETEYHKQILAGAAAYVEHRISDTKFNSKPRTEYGVMAIGRQKMKGKSIPLI